MIDTEFLADLAVYTDGRIAKVVLNSSYEITTFDIKQVDNHAVVLNYFVSATDVPHISLVELMDSAGNRITSNDVDVPLASDTIILQTIQIKEVR